MSSPSRDLSKSVDDLISDLDKLNSDGTSVSISRANAIATITAYGSRRHRSHPGPSRWPPAEPASAHAADLMDN